MPNLLQRDNAAAMWQTWQASTYLPAFHIAKAKQTYILPPINFPVTTPATNGAGIGIGSSGSVTLIGTGSNGVAYFSLPNLAFPFYTVQDNGESVPVDSSNSYFKLHLDYMSVLTGAIVISSGSPGCTGVETDDGTVYPMSHTGYPVCAAVPIGSDNYLPVAAMDAEELTVAGCESAFGSSGWVFGSSGWNTVHIHIVSFGSV